MLIKTLLFTALIFTTSIAQAETSWYDTALEFIGFGADESKEAPLKESPTTEDVSEADNAPAVKNVVSLTSMVTEKLGVSQQQAEGGLGTLFGMVKSTLDSPEFSQLSQYVPEMNSLLQAAPAISEDAKGLSSLLGKAGKYGEALQSGSQAYAQFKTLGLDAAQIPRYIEVTNEFLENQGGTDISSLFSKSLESLM